MFCTSKYRVQLCERHQRASESMAKLGQDIRRLTNLAYLKAPNDVSETLAKEFVDSLVNIEMRLEIKQARPGDLKDTVRHTVELGHSIEPKIDKQDRASYSEPAEDKTLSEAFSSLNS